MNSCIDSDKVSFTVLGHCLIVAQVYGPDCVVISDHKLPEEFRDKKVELCDFVGFICVCAVKDKDMIMFTLNDNSECPDSAVFAIPLASLGYCSGGMSLETAAERLLPAPVLV